MTLTDEDRAAIALAAPDGCFSDDPCCGTYNQAIYLAGLAAGIARERERHKALMAYLQAYAASPRSEREWKERELLAAIRAGDQADL